jgi:uncharacterized membrane protein YvbJ
MVYCTKCGTKNADDAVVCVNCGSSLGQTGREYPRRGGCFGSSERRAQDECFGLPYGGAIASVIIGISLVIIGLAIYYKIDIGSLIGPSVIIIIGILIILGTLYGYRYAGRR